MAPLSAMSDARLQEMRKEWFMRSLGSLKQDRHTEAVALMLVPNTRAGVAPRAPLSGLRILNQSQ